MGTHWSFDMKAPIADIIQNEFVTLSPLLLTEARAYADIGKDADIWTYLSSGPLATLVDAEAWIAGMLQRGDQSGDVSFSVYDNASGHLAGSSSYLDVRREHAGIEIGYTWYGKAFQRTRVNSATKLALLQHAFEVLGVNRVQLQTDSRNQASQRAIERLGAVREGVLRKHKIYPDGYVRDSVMYSITTNDWPAVKHRLAAYLIR